MKYSRPAPPPPPAPGQGRIRFLDAGPRHCRRPLWTDPATVLAEKFVCGGVAEAGRSYCPACRLRVVSPAEAERGVLRRDRRPGVLLAIPPARELGSVRT